MPLTMETKGRRIVKESSFPESFFHYGSPSLETRGNKKALVGQRKEEPVCVEFNHVLFDACRVEECWGMNRGYMLGTAHR